jgi:subtilase family serine protease
LLVSSADDGAAGCDNQDTESAATLGLAVNGFASPPEATAVGGTEFDADVNSPSTYWNSTNGANGGSAISYIPELAWNDGTEGTNLSPSLWASGGGKSAFYSKPVWQSGTGVPNDNARDVPDVAITASANHDGYIFCTNIGSGGTYTGSCANGIASDVARVGGTSASAPVFAGILVLLNHYLNKNKGTAPGLGNINSNLYSLATSTPAAFHDVPSGNYSLTGTPSGNKVPCQSSPATPNCPSSAPFEFGYLTGTGYDQITGLGSVDANKFVTAWAGVSLTPTTTTLAKISPATVTASTSVPLSASITPVPPDNETVNFTNGVGGSVIATAKTKSGTATTSATLAGGTYNVVAYYVGDATYAASNSPAQTLNVEDFTLSPSTLSITVSSPGQSGAGVITYGLLGGLSAAPTFSCTGLPSESTCTFAAGTTANTEVVTIGTTAASWMHGDPLGRGQRIFYALFVPGLMGLVVLPGARRKRTLRRVLGLMAVLALLTLWLPACNGGGHHNPGTPTGQSTLTVTATESNITHNIAVTLNVQ